MKTARKRVIIESVTPQIDGGRFAVRRAAGENVRVEADIFVDGTDKPAAELLHRERGETGWKTEPMLFLENDRWGACFSAREPGEREFTVEAWIDRFNTWKNEVEKKSASGLDISLELKEGAVLVREAAARACGADAKLLETKASDLERKQGENRNGVCAVDEELARLMSRYPDKRLKTGYHKILRVRVEKPLARFGAWYEMFPRSCSEKKGKHGTFQDCIDRLPYIASMGFDVLYLPPVHPIGKTNRKGRDNRESAGPGDPGSPWAIGSEDGGHRETHPELGTEKDFLRLVSEARNHGIEIALDIAFQCSPDHPTVR